MGKKGEEKWEGQKVQTESERLGRSTRSEARKLHRSVGARPGPIALFERRSIFCIYSTLAMNLIKTMAGATAVLAPRGTGPASLASPSTPPVHTPLPS